MSPERQQSSYPAAAHAVFAGFSCQRIILLNRNFICLYFIFSTNFLAEEEMNDSQAEKDRKSQGEDEEEWE